MSIGQNFLVGLFSGMAGTIAGYPFDVLKTEMQVSRKNMFVSSRSIINRHGWSGFYKGLISPLIGRAPVKGVLFASYQSSYNVLTPVNNLVGQYMYMAFCGGIAGMINSLVCSPIELIKITNQRGVKFWDKIRHDNLQYLTRGWKETIYREIPYYIIYFPLYNFSKIKCDQWKISPFWAGGVAGVLPWIITYPLDVIKTQKQNPYGDCSINKLWESQGYRGFYNGLIPTILRAFPTHGVTWLTYEWLKSKYS